MRALAVALRQANEIVEDAATARQHAGLTGPPADTSVIGALQFLNNHLDHAAEPLEPELYPKLRVLVLWSVMVVTWVASSTVALLLVQDPAEPAVLAAALVGGATAASIVSAAVRTVWDRIEIRSLAHNGEPEDLLDTIADLRTRIAAIMVALEPGRNDEHIVIGRRIENGLIWLDTLEDEVGAGRTPRWGPAEPPTS